MVALPHGLLQVIWIVFSSFLSLLAWLDKILKIGSLIISLTNDPIQLFQPSTSKRRIRAKAEPFEHRLQPHSDLDPQQLPLTSLQADTKALVNILEIEAMLIGGYQVVFEGCIQNTNKDQMVSHCPI